MEWLPVFVIPFAVISLLAAAKIWHDLPEATRRFNAEKEAKLPRLAGMSGASQ